MSLFRFCILDLFLGKYEHFYAVCVVFAKTFFEVLIVYLPGTVVNIANNFFVNLLNMYIII